MNRNQLKIIACLSMLIDHVGLVLFPDVVVFRLIGRLAMPMFAFFIGEGCRYTRNKKAYFLRVFILGLICQVVYIIEAAINGGDGFYLNILLTFSVSIPLCYLLDYAEKCPETAKKDENLKILIVLTVSTAVFLIEKGLCVLFDTILHINLTFDYGFTGICLPLFATVGKNKSQKLLSFTLGLLLFCGVNYGGSILWSLFAMLSLLLLCLYNGKGGERNLKYFFYAFYPLHLVVIYVVDMLI